MSEKTTKASELINLDFLTKGKGKAAKIGSAEEGEIEKPKRKRGRPKKSEQEKQQKQNVEVLDANAQTNLSMTQTNDPYLNTYDQTNNMLHTAIMQVDMYNNQVMKDIENVRSSKTLKNKYNYITDLTGIGSNLINTKITAIRELNKTITDSHNLELKRMKEISAQQATADNDDKYLMDMYNAFIQAPMNTFKSGIGSNQMAFQNGGANLLVSAGGQSPLDNGMLTPEQNLMRMENNPNIKTVLVLNAVTGERHFDVMDMSTGESIPNVPRPDPMFLEDTIPYPNENVARNVNLDTSYPLIIVGDNSSLNLY